LKKDYLGSQRIDSIYFGGGTPSLLAADEISLIIDRIAAMFSLSHEAEITLEANPDDVNRDWSKGLRQTAVNRISLGVQSFFDDDLLYLHRRHSGAGARNAIGILQEEQFDNLTIDLIYGIPTLGMKRWKKNLETFMSFGLKHLSAYALTVEPQTALYRFIEKGKIKAPEEESSIAHFSFLLEFMEDMGFVHYEISNFAKDGKISRHNCLYWTGQHYLGLGPSAHSYNGRSRSWNISSVKDWVKPDQQYKETFEEEILSTEQRFNEYVMTSLRTMWGCNLEIVRQQFGEKFEKQLLKNAQRYLKEEKLEKRNEVLYLTRSGKLFADGIASDLFN
jgi:oxygen-independent coproporphyrinogen-3 oxidase